ncbi:MAG: M24 family metallopeptidase [Candidatus Thorarchaeota archaeon]
MRYSVLLCCFFLLSQGLSTTPVLAISDFTQSEMLYNIEASRSAANITSQAIMDAKHTLQRMYERPQTQASLSQHLDSVMRAIGSDPDLGFPTLVMSGADLLDPHGDMTDDMSHYIDPAFENIVMIDMGCRVEGHCADITRTYFFEDVGQEVLDAYIAVLNAQKAVIEEIKAGASIRDLDALVRSLLAGYIGDPEIYFHPYWGHGVGKYVHARPYLWGGNRDSLIAGDIIAIEPGLISEAGWSVRVEDMILVTNTGAEILSNAPKELSDIFIRSDESNLNYSIVYDNYAYGNEISVRCSIEEEKYESVNITYHDGYEWKLMRQEKAGLYTYRYPLNYSYSSLLWTIVCCKANDMTYFFSQYNNVNIEADAEYLLNDTIQLEGVGSDRVSQSVNHSNSALIRFRFKLYDAPDWDQMLVLDSKNSVLQDYRNRSGKFWWTPWASGDRIFLTLISTGSPAEGGMSEFHFEIDAYQIVAIPTSTTDASIPISESNSTPTDIDLIPVQLGVGVLGGFAGLTVIVFVLWVRRRK